MKKLILAIAVVASLASCTENYSNGERIGMITKSSKKGWVWSSWEGTLNTTQTGMNSGEPFEFSIDNDVNDEKVISTLDSAANNGWKVKVFFWGFYFGLKVIAFVWAVTGTVYFIWSILKKPVTNFFEWLVDLELPKTRAFFAFLSTIIVAPFVFLIIKPVQFFIMYFKAVKNENCPAIIWEEEK